MNFLDNHLIIILVRKLVKVIISILFSLLVLAYFSQVIARYVFNSPLAWSEEMTRYLHVWIILLASSVCIRIEKINEVINFKY